MVWRIVKMNGLLDAIASATSVVAVPYNDAIQKGVELLIEQSVSWAQATTLLLGVLATLWIAKGDDPRLAFRTRLVPEIAMCCAGMLMLFASLYCYHEYLAGIVTALEAGGSTSPEVIKIPNVFHEKYEALRGEQLTLLLFGFVASGLAVFSVRNLSGGDDVQK